MPASSGAIRAGRAFVELFVDDSRLVRGLQRARMRLQSFGSFVTTIGTKMFAGGAALMAPFLATLDVASDLQEGLNKFNAVFGKEAAAAEKFVDQLAKNVGRSAIDIRDSMSSFQAMFVGLGFDPAKSRQMSETLQALAIDFGSFFNVSDEEANNRFLSALSGSSEVLDRFGINIKAAALDQKFLEMGLDKTTANATEQEKVMARLAIIMEAMTSQGAVGDAVKTAGSFANQMKRLQGEIKDFAAAVGGSAIAVLAPFVRLAAEGIAQAAAWAKENQRFLMGLVRIAAGVTAAGAALIGLGTAMTGAAVAIGVTSTVAGAAGTALQVVLFPAIVAVTAATRTAQATSMAFAAASRAAAATIAATAVALRAVAAATSIVAYASKGAILAMTLFGIVAAKTKLVLTGIAIASTAITWTFRGAAAATMLLGTAMKTLAITSAALAAIFGVLSNPVVAAGVVVAALAVGIYSLMQRGVTLGGVLDWLKEKFGPLVQTVKEAFGVITEALMGGEWQAAANVAMAGLKLAFVSASDFIRDKWLDLQQFLGGAWIDLAAAVESTWVTMANAIAQAILSSVQQALAVAAAAAEHVGQDTVARNLKMVGAGVGFAGAGLAAEAAARVAEIDDLAAETRETLGEDIARRRSDGSDVADARAALDEAMEAARTSVTEAAEKDQGLLDVFNALQNGAGATTAAAGNVDTAGTFSSLSSRIFLTRGSDERIADATEETARNTRAIARAGGLAFTA